MIETWPFQVCHSVIPIVQVYNVLILRDSDIWFELLHVTYIYVFGLYLYMFIYDIMLTLVIWVFNSFTIHLTRFC